MIYALNALPAWPLILALAVIGVLALVGAAVCLVLIKKTKKEMEESAAEEIPESVAEKVAEEPVVEEEPVAEPEVTGEEAAAEEEIAEEPAPVEEVAEEPEPVVEEVAEEVAEPVEEAAVEEAVAEEPEETVEDEVSAEPEPEPAPVVEEVAVEEEPAPIEEEIAEEPAPVEEVAEEPVPAPVAEEVVEESVPVVEEEPKAIPIIVRKAAPEGKVFIKVHYNRSYTAKLIQSVDTVKDYYTEIKNELMRYKVSNRTSWKYETFRRGRKLLVKLAVRGKSLYVYFALNPADYADTKYKINDVSHVASNASVPVLYKIKNDRRCRYAKQLIADVMAANGLEAGAERSENYALQYPYEEVEPLIERGLIKLLKWEEAAAEAEVGVIAVPVEMLPDNAVEAAEEEIAATAEEVEEFGEEEIEEVAEVIEEAPADEPVEAPAEEPEEEVAEETIAEPEPVEEPEEPAGITVAEAEEQIADEDVESYVQVSHKFSDKTKKAVVNIDTLGRYFNGGETVTVEEVRKRVPGIGKKVTYIKVLARGRLDKALTVEADDFSPAAIKMIVLTGGQVIRTKANIN